MFSERKIWNDGAPFEDFMGRDEAPPVARRHLAFGGGKGGAGGTTYQQQTTTIPPEVRARYDAVNARAETAAQQPFQPYTGQFVSPLTATQQAGIGQIAAAGQGYQPYQQAATTALTGAAEAALPYYGQAGQNIDAAQAAGAPYTGAATMAGMAGAQAVNPGQLQIGQYMDPYLQSVVAPTMQGLYQQQQQQQSQLMGSQAMRGAFGGDRGSIAAANLARQQGLAAQQAQGGLLSQGYGQALQAAQQQQGVGLQAGQANRAAMQQLSPQLLQIGQQAFQQPMAAAQAQQGLGQGLLGYGQNVAQGLSGLGQQGTQTGLASGQALLGAGTLEQQTQQQLNAALQNQYQQQQGYPFQIAQFLANIAYGGGPLYGSTTSGVTGSPTPFFSDERLKEDIREIGRTHDGQKIIKFRYKGEPEGTSHIGLSAQDVEKHHPEAVSETAEGIKAVDYDMATKPAERAYGGGLLPSSEGGAVHPSMAGLGAPRPAFAGAGAVTPGIDARSQQILEMLANPGAGSLPYGTAGKSLPKGQQQGWSLTKLPPATLKGPGLAPPPPPPKSTGEVVGGGIKDAVGAVGTGKEAYKFGKEAYKEVGDWWREQRASQQPAQPGYAASTSPGSVKTESLPPPTQPSAPPAQPSVSAAPGLGAAPPQQTAEATTGLAPSEITTAPQQTAEATTGLAPSEITTASLGELPTEDLGGLGEGLEGLSMFAARGGRIGYEGGGGIDAPDKLDALPYGGEKDTILGGIAKPVAPAKLDTPKLGMSSGAGGAGGQQKKDPAAGALKGAMSGASAGAMLGPWGALAGGVLGGIAGAVARGGRIGYAEGGGQTFVDRLMPAALKASEKTGVHPHLILAQAALESGWGKHAPGNNYFGIKGPGQVLDTKEQGATGLYNTRDSFRKYESPEHSVDDYANFIMSNSRYRPVREARTLDEQIEAMGRSGYATDKDYTAKLRSIANSLSGNATPFTPRERGHETPTAPPQRSAGLAPPLHDVEDMREGLEPIDTGDDFEMPDRFEMPNRFASGGLVPRHGYQTAGSVPRLDYQTASEEGVPSGVSEEDRQRELQRGLREEPFALPPGLGGLNLPQHQPPMLDPEVRAALDTERMKPSWQGEYDTPSATPPAAQAPTARTGVAPPLPPPQAVQTAPGGTPPASTGVVTPPAANDPNRITTTPLPPSGGAPPPQQENRDFFDRAGDWMGRNQNWLMPLAGGIGKMLASPSPYLGVAIGQGLGEAAQMYPMMSYKQQGIDINKQQADLASARQFYDVYKDTLGRLNAADFAGNPTAKQALQDQANNLSSYITKLLGKYVGLPKDAQNILNDISGGAAPATSTSPSGQPSAPASTQTQPASSPAPGATTATSAPEPPKLPVTQRAQAVAPRMFDSLPDERNPLKIIEKANRLSGTAPLEQVVALYNQASQIEQNWAQSGRYQDRDGVDRIVPGWLENKMQELRGTKNVQYFADAEVAARTRSNAMATLDDMQKALESYQSGHFDNYVAQANGVLSGLGLPPISDKKDLAEYQRFLKDSYAMIFNQMGAMGGSPMKIEMEGWAKTVPTAVLQPKANKTLLTNLKAMLSREDKLFTDQVNAAQANPAAFDPSSFYGPWSKIPENDPRAFKERVGREMAVRGVQPEGTDDVGKKFIVEPTKTNGLSRPTPMYLLRFEPTPDGRAYIPIYGASR